MNAKTKQENKQPNGRQATWPLPALSPHRICETLSGNLAHTIGRVAFRPGRPMLVEHVGGLYLEHALNGVVLTPGYSDDYAIVHIWDEERERLAA